MNQVHIALQGKGGIGKSLACRFLGEYLEAICIDADPENRTLSECKALNVREHDLLDRRKSIDQFAIDALMEIVIDETADIVVDIGASSFVEVNAYFAENDLERVFKDAGKVLWVHLLVVGGPMQGACLRAVTDRIKADSDAANVCVWENEYFGPIEIESETPGSPETLTTSGVLAEAGFKHVILPQRGKLFVGALETMISNGLTFDEAIDYAPTVLSESRIRTQRDELWAQLDQVFGKEDIEVAA